MLSTTLGSKTCTTCRAASRGESPGGRAAAIYDVCMTAAPGERVVAAALTRCLGICNLLCVASPFEATPSCKANPART